MHFGRRMAHMVSLPILDLQYLSSSIWSSGDFALLCAVLLMPGDVGEPLNTSAYFSMCNLRDMNACRAAVKQVSEHVFEQDCTRILRHLVPLLFFSFRFQRLIKRISTA